MLEYNRRYNVTYPYQPIAYRQCLGCRFVSKHGRNIVMRCDTDFVEGKGEHIVFDNGIAIFLSHDRNMTFCSTAPDGEIEDNLC